MSCTLPCRLDQEPIVQHLMTAPPFRLAAFYSIYAGATSLALYLIREPLGGPGGRVFLLYWLEATALMGVAVAGLRFAGSRYLAFFVMTLVLFLLAGLSSWLYIPVLLVAAGVATWVFADTLRESKFVTSNVILLAAPLLAAIYFFQLNSMRYDSVFLPELVLSGTAFPDTLFHTALSSILVSYGKIASALDGFEPIRYHIFSHLWFGLAAKAAGTNVVNGYYIGMQVLGVPLLFFGLTLSALAYMPTLQPMPTAALLIVLPLALLCAVERYDWMSYLESESYTVGLLLFLVGLFFLRTLAEGDTYSLSQVIVGLGYGLLLMAAKISVGAVWMLAVLYVFARSATPKKMVYVVTAALVLLDVYVVLNFTLPNDNVSSTSLEPFHFIRTYTTVALANLVPITLAGVGHLREWLRGDRKRWNEVALLMLALTVLPTLVLRIEGGSAYYFLNVGTWLAIASLTARLAVWAQERQPVSICAIALAGIGIGTLLTPEKSAAYHRLKQQRDALYSALYPNAPGSISDRGLFDRKTLRILSAAAKNSVGAKIGRELRDMRVTAGSPVMVTIAPEFRAYWKLTAQCNAVPFLVPSFFGLPLLKGLPPANEACDLGSYYGYSHYGASSRASRIDDEGLCRRAGKKGFGTLLILSEDGGRRLDCTAQKDRP